MKVSYPELQETLIVDAHIGDRFISKGLHYVIVSDEPKGTTVKIDVEREEILVFCFETCDLTTFDAETLIEIITDKWIIE